MEESLKYRNIIVVINVSLAFLLGISIGVLSVSENTPSPVATEQSIDLDTIAQ